MTFSILQLSGNIPLEKAKSIRTVVLKLGSTEPQGFGEAVVGVRLRSE